MGETINKKLLDILHGAWNIRCQIVHAKETGGLYIEEERLLNKDISDQYKKAYQKLKSNKSIYFTWNYQNYSINH